MWSQSAVQKVTEVTDYVTMDTATHLECTQDGIVISISRSGDSSPAKKIQVEEIKDLLTHYIGKTGYENQFSLP